MLNFFKKLTFLFYITGISILAQNQDTTISYSLKPIEVTAERTVMTQVSLEPSKDRLANILGSNGFSLIRKGVFFAQDIYADGLKKSDISVVVDGERYHTACPNRMDSPLTRVNPIELDKVDLFKTNGSLQSSLGGVVNFHRKTPLLFLEFKPEFQVITVLKEVLMLHSALRDFLIWQHLDFLPAHHIRMPMEIVLRISMVILITLIIH